ncbi:GxxExxY protein [Panacibacter ginsenosidivorans]|uniref:GxxExxY protein n=1 Tax=Panacibacter ginsenosidivorans TaxID=1813871 RepID=A0A5B8VDJ8_9BACT|nr:GxxExxY protein [Panacibacter ginsenosidivorans]QEC69392.1 GxxExxY protein [Panacibacter ginsenosidivorans]
MTEIIYKEESYKIIGLCMEVHKQLGMGFKEIIYKDALEIELNNAGISFIREQQYDIEYKGIILPHKYYADFVIEGKIIMEIKASSMIVNNFVSQTINYLKASGIHLGIIANFGEKSFTSKRIVF